MPGWRNFSRSEFQCHCCGENEITDEFIDVMQQLRTEINIPLHISSGYRCSNHAKEKGKPHKGAHGLGIAADITISRQAAHKLLEAAYKHPKVTGIGINQTGGKRFIHIDIASNEAYRPRPITWTY